MIHREQQPSNICAEVSCDEFSSNPCLRCALPLCDKHAFAEDRRCDDCETDYELLLGPLPSLQTNEYGTFWFWGCMGPLVFLFLLTRFFLFGILVLLMPLIANLVGRKRVKSIHQARRDKIKHVRGKFLLERHTRKQLPS